MKLILGADHRGTAALAQLFDKLRRDGHEVVSIAPKQGEHCDYPDSAYKVGTAVAGDEADMGILICGTGVGMCMAANKVRGVRAACVHDELTAQLSRSHNDANILCLSADLLGQHLIEKITDVWINTPFEGGRHARRVRKIEAIERGESPATVAK